MPKGEQGTRRELRRAGQGCVRLEWPDAIRGRQATSVRVIDISVNGMKVALTNPIALGTYLQLKSKDYGLTGMAAVKHCLRDRMGYQVGLEFSGFQWRAPDARH